MFNNNRKKIANLLSSGISLLELCYYKAESRQDREKIQVNLEMARNIEFNLRKMEKFNRFPKNTKKWNILLKVLTNKKLNGI